MLVRGDVAFWMGCTFNVDSSIGIQWRGYVIVEIKQISWKKPALHLLSFLKVSCKQAFQVIKLISESAGDVGQ